MNSTLSFFLSQLRGAGSPRDSHVGEEPASTGRELVHARRDELTHGRKVKLAYARREARPRLNPGPPSEN